jgi:hypothetical protein
VTLGKQGVRTTVGLPGTGVSYTELSRPQAPPNPGQRRRHPALLLILAALLILVALLLIAAAPAPALDMPDSATTGNRLRLGSSLPAVRRVAHLWRIGRTARALRTIGLITATPLKDAKCFGKQCLQAA